MGFARALGSLIFAEAKCVRIGHTPFYDLEVDAAQEELAAALLVLTDPAEAIRAFLDEPSVPRRSPRADPRTFEHRRDLSRGITSP